MTSPNDTWETMGDNHLFYNFMVVLNDITGRDLFVPEWK